MLPSAGTEPWARNGGRGLVSEVRQLLPMLVVGYFGELKETPQNLRLFRFFVFVLRVQAGMIPEDGAKIEFREDIGDVTDLRVETYAPVMRD